MDKKPNQASILVEAKVSVVPLEDLDWKGFVGLKRDMRPSFFVNGLHYASIVEKINDIISPGENGNATFLMATDSLLETDTAVGSKVELKSGPTVIAVAEILSIKRVWVKRDHVDKRGYAVLDDDQ